MRSAVLLVALLAAVLGAPATAFAWLGVMADGPLTAPGAAYPEEWRTMHASGVRMVRTTFSWRDIEPSRGSFDFSRPDEVVAAAAAAGITVLPVVERTPGWAKLVPDDASSPPRAPADYARFMQALVTRYGPSGSYWLEHPELSRRPIRAWQVWNEPNLTRYWSEQPFARRYVKLLRAARTAVRAKDRAAKILLAGLPNEAWTAMSTVYDAGGRGAFDIAAVHPYTGKPRNLPRYVAEVRKVMRKRKDGRRPIWVTEFSWPASKGKTKDVGGFTVTDKEQARRLAAGAEHLRKARRRLRIGQVFWYTWLSPPEGSPNAFDYSGLRRLQPDGSIRSAPAFAPFRKAAIKASK